MPNLRDEFGETYKPLQQTTNVAIPQRPDGYLRAALDPSALFYDTFDSALDTTNRWTTSGGTAPTSTNGILTVSAGTTALATSIITSQPTFQLLGNMYNQCVAIITVDSGLKLGNYRFFGLGVAAGSPTIAAPITNGVGFEWDGVAGVLYGVVYSGGVRTQSVSLSSYQPTDGANHRYNIYFKTSRVYFEIDNVSDGSIAYPSPNVSNLPTLLMSVNGASTVSPAAVLTASFVGVGDTASNSNTQSDGTYPWRKAQIGADGARSERHAGTYQASYSTAFNVAAAASATDIAVISGSATKTVYIQRIIVTGIQTTAGLAEVLLIKRSTADTGGTSSAPGIVPHDSQNAAASAVVLAYTANPAALGTAVGTFRRAYTPVAGATSVVNPIVIFDFGDKAQAITLRGTAQQLAVNLNGVTITGGTFDIVIEWYEI